MDDGTQDFEFPGEAGDVETEVEETPAEETTDEGGEEGEEVETEETDEDGEEEAGDEDGEGDDGEEGDEAGEGEAYVPALKFKVANKEMDIPKDFIL